MLEPQTLVNIFRDVNDMLTELEEIILASRAHSPFNDYLTQLSAEQNRAVSNGVAELRTEMICILRQHGIVTNNPTVQTAWAARKIIAAAASRFDDLGVDATATPSTGTDRELFRLLLQMKNAFIHMDQALSSPDSAQLERRLSP